MKYLELEICRSSSSDYDAADKDWISKKGYVPPRNTGSVIYSIVSVDICTSGVCLDSFKFTYPNVVIRVTAEKNILFVCLWGNHNVSKFLTQFRSPSQPIVSLRCSDIEVSYPCGLEVYNSIGEPVEVHSGYMEKSKGETECLK